jgi:hypothetical protein
MLASGKDRPAIEREITGALVAARSRVKHAKDIAKFSASTYGSILHRWHHDRRYLDANANPKPIRLLGRAPSVESLVQAEIPKTLVKNTVRHMRVHGLIVPFSRQRFLPVGKDAIFQGASGEIIKHAALLTVRLMRTIETNISRSDRGRRLLQRSASVDDLPRTEVKAFRDFSRAQGAAFISHVNDWLESRRVARRRGASVPTVSAGVHVHAHLD